MPLNCCRRPEIPPHSRNMSFDVVFVVVNDQRRLLLEQSKPQYGVGDAGLLRNWFFDHSARAVEQISSRVRSLSTLFALFSDQACTADFCPVRCGSSSWNSLFLFSLTKAAVGILFASPKTRAFARLASLDLACCRSCIGGTQSDRITFLIWTEVIESPWAP